MVTLFNLNGNNPLESAVPPKNIGVFLDQSIPPPVAVSTPDSINLTALPGITTTINVAYNDYNRRLVINPRTFASGDVNTTNNTITISNHGYRSGE